MLWRGLAVVKSLKKGGGCFTTNKDFSEKIGRRYCLPIMIPYLHEKIQEIRWSRFLENRLTNWLTDWPHINYYSTNLTGPCPLGTGVQNDKTNKLGQQITHSFPLSRNIVECLSGNSAGPCCMKTQRSTWNNTWIMVLLFLLARVKRITIKDHFDKHSKRSTKNMERY